jgi:hypothetical protein
MALSGLAAVLGFLTVERAARQAGRGIWAPILGLVTGLFLIAVPGMIFKNYNPLAVVANAWCLLGFVLAASTREACWRALIGGVVLGLTWAARIDLGTFLTVLWIAVLFARLFGARSTLRQRFASSAAGLLLLAAGIVLGHAPVLLDGWRRGYLVDFLSAYPRSWKQIASKVPGFSKAPAPKPAAANANVNAAENKITPPVASTPAVAKQGAWKNDTLARTTWQDVQNAPEKKRHELLGLYLLTYFPVLALLVVFALGFGRWFAALREGADPNGALAVLALIGSSLALFPQYFFWRPDAPHLSEFGPGYWTAVIASLALLGWGASWRVPARWLGFFLALHAGIWFWRMLPDRWCGTIAARENREVLFEGENGARVFEQKKVVAWMNEVLRLIREHSKPDEYLLVYPYHPTFNVIANRRTYEKKLYMDNAEVKPGWGAAAIKRIQEHRPAMIIVSDWDVNGTEASRFRNWAADVYAHIRENYDLLGTFDEKEKFEVYARKAAAVPAAPQVQ